MIGLYLAIQLTLSGVRLDFDVTSAGSFILEGSQDTVNWVRLEQSSVTKPCHVSFTDRSKQPMRLYRARFIPKK